MGYETAKIITEEGLEGLGRYYSIYRGIVVDNNDPDYNMSTLTPTPIATITATPTPLAVSTYTATPENTPVSYGTPVGAVDTLVLDLPSEMLCAYRGVSLIICEGLTKSFVNALTANGQISTSLIIKN